MNTNYFEFSFSVGGVNIDTRFDYSDTPGNIRQTSYAIHTHTMYEAFFIENGSLLLECDGDILELSEHDILVIFPGTEHRIISCSENIQRFNFRFLFKKLADQEHSDSYYRYSPSQSIKNNIFQNISSIYLYFENTQYKLNSFRIKNCFGIIVSYIAEQILPLDYIDDHLMPENSDTLTQQILIDQFFHDKYSGNVRIEDLSSLLHYSKAHTNRLLLKYTNMSFSENLSLARMNAAKKYLISTDLKISDISYKCGFSSLRGFEIFFKKHTNILPAEFRRLNSGIEL